jgi:hypothetical protein
MAHTRRFYSDPFFKRQVGESRMMIHRLIGPTSAAVLLAISTVSASAAPVNRSLADELTRQFNQQELEQLQSDSAGAYSQPAYYRQQLYQPEITPPPAAVAPPQAEWSYLPR